METLFTSAKKQEGGELETGLAQGTTNSLIVLHEKTRKASDPKRIPKESPKNSGSSQLLHKWNTDLDRAIASFKSREDPLEAEDLSAQSRS